MNAHFIEPVRGKTRKGAKTRERIIETACDLIMTKGVAHTNLDEILAQSNTGKGQFYHYFESKDNLVKQVLIYQANRFIQMFSTQFEQLDNWQGFEGWFQQIVEMQLASGMRGCPFGTLSSELANLDPALREEIQKTFTHFESYLVRGLNIMKERGELRENTDPQELARFIWSTIEGAILVTKTFKDISSLQISLKHLLRYLKSHSSLDSSTSSEASRSRSVSRSPEASLSV